MPHRRKPEKGSFGTHLAELVEQFPDDVPASRQPRSAADERELKEKRDIHALLFEQAWRMDRPER